ncbi:MAG: DUF11 domain-containing protein, partial [Anaerolineae bacterium]|nr:DUF11 domain-containing protein [Anaerolineae bacterium]
MTTLIVILLVLSFSLVSILRLGHYLFNHLGRLQTKPVSAGFKPGRNGIIFSIIFLPLLTILTVTLWQINLAKAAGTLTVEILAGYNLVVDSNVTSPSTFGPSAATVAGRVCNTGTDPITHVQVYIGNATANTPGLYPRRYTTDPDFAVHTALLDGGGSYAFTHEGGSLGLSDATRPAGTLAPGQCTVQYWTFSYPRCENVGGNPDEPQCQGDAVWGDSVKPNDDLWLNFDVWATGDGVTKQTATWTMHLRNEISAMANKIEPNGNPGGQWFNTDPMTIRPGGLITTNGILYRIGNVRFGFDNDGDYLPDYNFWVQPIGNPSGFDPGCFRLIRTTGVITVEGGSATSFNFTDQLYFTYPQVPDDNTNVIGEVFYTFIALGSNCSVTPSPYQEAASGYDNEKFNADYGTGGTVPMSVPQALVTIDKSGNPDLVSLGQIISYTMPFVNQSATESAGLTFYSGAYVNNPLVISDTIAAGTQYIAGSATYALSFTPNNGVKILYSTDYGQTWSEVEPVPAASVTTIQWWLQDPLPPTESGTASFAVQVPAVYSGGPVIENCANAQFGTGPSIGQACDSTLVLGNNSVGDRVWRDDNANGLQDAESSLPNITVWLYYDKNGDGALDNNDLLIMTDTTTSDATNYLFTDLPDAKYLVKVDHMDSDRPTGYSLTTDEIFAVDLDSGHADSNPVAYLDADFGFGPALRVTKSLLSPVAYEGQDITYRIRVENVRPGDGSGTAGTCTYSTWAQTEDAAHTGSSAAAWDYPERVFGTEEPDENYAFTDISNNTDLIAGTNFNLGGVKGNITKVEAIFSIYLSGPLANDEVEANIWYNDVLSGTKTYNATNGNLGEVNALSPGQANQGILAWDITTLGNWQASDFNGSILDLAFATNKGGGAGDANFYLDAIGFRVTTDETCGSPSDTLNPVPLTDVFDASLLEFVSADPPHTSIGSGSTPYGNTGIINWNNIGPLHAGGTEEIIVTFRGLDPGVTPKPLTNTAQVQNAYFATGEPANDDEDDAVTTITATGSISGVVWSDPNINGWQSPVGYESGTDFFIPNVTVVLHQCIGSGLAPSKPCSGSGNSGTWTAIYTETTDSNGHYLFDGLLDGYYRVVVDETTILDGSPTQTGDPDITPGLCGPSGDNQWGAATNNLNTLRVINNANHIINGNFGYYVYSAIYGTIWQDYNADGIFDGNEPGLDNGAGGITVRLYNSGGSVIATTQTDADGYYEFNTDSGGNPLSAGTYTIEVDAFGTFPSGTWSQTGDPDASLDNQHTVTITNGQVSGSHDFGYIGDSDIGDTIFTDWDGDGTKDTGDAGISNITVYLYHDANGDGILNSGDTPIMTDTTDANGNYLFENLPVGDYVVQVDETALTGMSQTADRDTTLDGRTAITTDGTNDILDADFGYQPFGTASIGDYVWKDQNGDGVQDLFESGISNILVSLYHDNGNGFLDSGDALITTTTTGPDGDYLFENLAAGDYLVRVDQSDSDLPTNYGSRYYLSTGNNPEVVTLSTGEACLDADFGFAPPGAIGDYIWQDNNADGNQDSNEPPLENVTVELYQGSTLIDTTQTDFTGHYLFTGLMSNTYRVVVTPPANYDLTYDPDAYADPTTAFPACDSDPTATYYNCDNEAEAQIYHGRMTRLDRDFGYKPPRAIGDFVWLDSDGDGVQDSGETGLGGVVITLTLPSGTKYTTATDIEGYYSFGSDVLTEDGDYTLTIDTTSLPKSGMVATYDDDSGTTSPDNQTVINISTTAFFTDVLDFGYRYAGPYSITGTVFFDQGHTADGTNDLFTTGDTPYANITVYLYESGSSIPKASTTTDASGHYTFTYLYDGDYTVSVKTTDPQIDGLTLTASPNGNSYNAVTISGASVSNQDFGFFEDRPILSITKTNDPTGNVAPGDTITYTIIVNNSGSLTATGVVITDRMPISVTFVSASTPYSTPTGGVITWTVGALPVSATHTVTMAVQLNTGVPAGTIITNTAWVTSNEGITDTDTVTNEVIGSTTDLTIVKSDQPDPVIAGQVLTYTLVYTNNGPADAQAVYITDTLPTSVTFGSVVSENPPLSGPTQTGQLLTWYTPTLATGASGSLIFTVTVGSGVSGTITNSVAITTTTPESNPNNNNDDEPTDVEGLATISGHLYLDTNGNGSQDIGEPDLVNVDV